MTSAPACRAACSSGRKYSYPGVRNDDVLAREAVGIVFAEAEADVQAAQRTGIIAEGGEVGFLVAQRDLRAECGELFDALFVADARADEGDFFALHERAQLFDRQHGVPLSGGAQPAKRIVFPSP